MAAMLADAGIPMIVVQMPGMVCTLIPVIAVETLIIRRRLAVPYGKAVKGVAAANLASTIVGVPLAWMAMLAIEYAVMVPVAVAANHWHWNLDSPVLGVFAFLLSIAWLGSIARHICWMIPAASALLLIPSFVVSVWLERPICIALLQDVDPALVKRGVLAANVVSYGLLFLVACGWLAAWYFRGEAI